MFGDLLLSVYGDEYAQLLNHNTNSFPFFKIIDVDGNELELEIEHTSNRTTIIKSNILVDGQIYML